MTGLLDARRDFAYAVRILSRNPGFTLVAILTIALGIGVNTTLFSIFNAVALKPLPVDQPDRIVRMKRWFATGSQGDIQYAFSYPEFTHLRDSNQTFSSMVASSSMIPVMARLGDSSAGLEKVEGQLVSSNYFSVLGVQAEIGQTFPIDEDRLQGANPVLVLSHAFWERRFNGDLQIIGRTIAIHNTVFTVIGVTPKRFTGTDLMPQVADFWTPMSMQAPMVPGQDWLNDPNEAEFQILARLKPSVTLSGAQPHVDALIRQFADTTSLRQKTTSVTLEHPALFGNVDDSGFRLLAAGVMIAVGLVLLVACANVSNMIIAHATMRQHEVAIRFALGAGRGRIIRQFMTENILLALAGGCGGLLLSMWLADILWTIVKQSFAGSPFDILALNINLAPDARVFGYAMLLSLLSAAAFGILPALQSADLRRFQRVRLRGALLAAQMVVSMIFLIGAALLGRGLMRSQDVNLGYETRDVYLLKAEFGRDLAKAGRTQAMVLNQLLKSGEIKGATLGTPPLFGTSTPTIVVNNTRDRTLTSIASDTFFDTMGIPILRGRGFTPKESEASVPAPVAILSEATARRFWPDQDSIGRHFQLLLPFQRKYTDFEVVGVVKDVRFANPTRLDPVHVYLPTSMGPHSLIVRIQGDRQAALAAVRKNVGRVDDTLVAGIELINLEQGPLWAHKTMPRAIALFLAVLGTIALALAGIGIYGVISYGVNRRIKEIGIRVALGAGTAAVLRSVILRSLWPAGLGIAVGTGCALGGAWLLHQRTALPGSSDFLQGIRFYDPVAFLGLVLFVVVIAMLASGVPLRRALKVDPAVALRHD